MEQLLTQVAKKYQDAFNRSTRTERTALVRIWAEEIMTPPLMMDAKTTSDRLLTLMEETFCKNVLIPYKRGKDCSAILGNQRLNEMFKIRKKDCLTIDRSVHMRMVQDVCETILAEGIQFWQENRDGTWIQLEKFDDTEKDQVFHLALTRTPPVEPEHQTERVAKKRTATTWNNLTIVIEGERFCRPREIQGACQHETTTGETMALGTTTVSKRLWNSVASDISSKHRRKATVVTAAAKNTGKSPILLLPISLEAMNRQSHSQVPGAKQIPEHPSTKNRATLLSRALDMIKTSHESDVVSMTGPCTIKGPGSPCNGVPLSNFSAPLSLSQNGLVPRSPVGQGSPVMFQCRGNRIDSLVACQNTYSVTETLATGSVRSNVTTPSLSNATEPETFPDVLRLTAPSSMHDSTGLPANALRADRGGGENLADTRLYSCQAASELSGRWAGDVVGFRKATHENGTAGVCHATKSIEELMKLCSKSDSVFRSEYYARNVLQELLIHCSESHNDATQLAWKRSEIIQLSMLGRKRIDYISKVLVTHCSDSSIQALGSSIFSFLAPGGKDVVQFILESSGFQMIILHMNAYRGIEELQLQGCRLLAALTLHWSDVVLRSFELNFCAILLKNAREDHPRNEELRSAVENAMAAIPTECLSRFLNTASTLPPMQTHQGFDILKGF